MRRCATITRMPRLVVVGVLALLAVGCGSPDGGSTGTESTRVLVYLLRGDEVGAAARRVPATQAVAEAALRELLRGPTAAEEEAGLGTAIPDGTELLDVAVEDGVATVDLSAAYDDGGGSAAMLARLAQVVFTATQFPTVDGVRYRIDGEPVETFSTEGVVLEGLQERSDYEEQSPAILVERPAVGDVVSSPLRLEGTANTFEATFQYALLAADGSRLADGFVTASCGTGCRGTFDVDVAFDAAGAESMTLQVWEPSARDGSRTKEVAVPLGVE